MGSTVLRSLLTHVPDADYLYFGDTARLPYGSKSAATVAHYTVGAIHNLQAQGAELLVIAVIRPPRLPLTKLGLHRRSPVIGVVEPGANAAAAASRNHKVVVIGTEATISSHAYRRALEARGIAAQEKACPLLGASRGRRMGGSALLPSKWRESTEGGFFGGRSGG